MELHPLSLNVECCLSWLMSLAGHAGHKGSNFTCKLPLHTNYSKSGNFQGPKFLRKLAEFSSPLMFAVSGNHPDSLDTKERENSALA